MGWLPSYGNIRVVDSNGGDSHSYWSIKFKDGSVSPGQHPWWEFAVYNIVLKIGPFIQATGAIFDFLCNCIAEFVNLIKKGWEKCKEFGAWVAEKIKELGKGFKELADNIGDFFGELFSKAKNWYNRNLNTGYKYASANPQIVVDTYKLRKYAQRLQTVNGRISRLDSRLDSLYWKVGLLDLWKLMQADILTGYSWRLNRCTAYLNDTASDFENVESVILNNL